MPLAASIAAGYVRSRWGAFALDQLLTGSLTGRPANWMVRALDP